MGKTSWEETRIDGKIVVITGASSGLGKQSAIELAQRGAKVYMLGRNKEKTDAAAQEVIDITVEPELVQVMVVDLASFKSIREFAVEFKQKEPKVDILMNNAGIMMVPQGKTLDGHELHFGTNVLGPYLLTQLLMDQLVAAAPGSRIINLASSAHAMGKKDMQWDNLMFDQRYDPGAAYCQSKLANILFNLELSKKVKSDGVMCYAVHPGVVKTNLFAAAKPTCCWSCFFGMAKPCFSSVQKGAQTQVMCAIDPSIAEDTGYYYANCKRKTPSRYAQNAESATKLWALCSEMVKLQLGETHSSMLKLTSPQTDVTEELSSLESDATKELSSPESDATK